MGEFVVSLCGFSGEGFAQGRAFAGVVGDVVGGALVVGGIGDGFDAVAFGSEAAILGALTGLSEEVGGVFFGQADPVVDVVVGEAGEDVEVG